MVLLGLAAPAVADDRPPGDQHGDGLSKPMGQDLVPQTCPSLGGHGAASAPASLEKNQARLPQFEGVQIETSNIKPYEVFFESILHAQPLLRIDHPQVDYLRGYWYRDVQIVVCRGQCSAVKEELDRALERAPTARADEVVRIRLKPDVPRSNCRVMRLEVTGPEGFMIGFNQFKEGTCKPHEHNTTSSKRRVDRETKREKSIPRHGDEYYARTSDG